MPKIVTVKLLEADAKHVEAILAKRPKDDAAIRVAYALSKAPRRVGSL